MNPLRTDTRAVNFAVCNLGQGMYDESEPQYSTSKIRSLNASPSSKTRLPCAFSNMMIGRKLPTAQVKVPKESKHMKRSPEGRGHNQHFDNTNINPVYEFDMAKGLTRLSLESKDFKSATSSRNFSNVKVVSLNDQAVVRKTPEPTADHFDSKQNKKYAHFRRTQNTTFTQYFGKIKNIIATKNKMTNSAVHLDKFKNNPDIDSPLAKGSHKEKEKLPVVEAKAKESILIKKNILNQEVHDNSRNPFGDDVLRGRDIIKKKTSIEAQGREKSSKSPALATTAMQWQQFLETTPLDTSTDRPYRSNNFDIIDNTNSQVDHTNTNLPILNKTSTKKFYMVENDKTLNLLSHRRVFSLFDSPKKNTEMKVYQEKVLPKEAKIKRGSGDLEPMIQANNKMKQRPDLNKLKDDSKEFQREVKTLETEESPQVPISQLISPVKTKNPPLRQISHTRWKTTLIEKSITHNTSPGRANNNGVIYLSKSNGKISPHPKQTKQIENNKNFTQEDATDFSIEGWESDVKGYN